MKKFTLFSFLVLLNFICLSQQLFEDRTFTRADTLRGSITQERIWWDLQHYDLSIKLNPSKKTISGKNTITYVVLESYNVMQIDLQMPLKINRIVQNGQTLEFTRDGNAHFIQLKEEQKKGATCLLEIEFSGKPIEAENA